ncbi:MAG: hypothetical protein ABI441_16045 [Flavobacterium sp.]
MGVIVFSYKKSDYDDKAQSFLKYFYSSITKNKRLSIQVNTKEVYNSYLTRLKSLGCKIINSKIENGEIIKFYEGSTIIINVRVATLKDEFASTKTFYTFSLFEKDDYYRNFTD